MNSFLVSGLMSGSSLDGVDLALCAFRLRGDEWEYQILASETYAYPGELSAMLAHASGMSLVQAKETDQKLGEFYGALLHDFHRKHRTKPDLIGSHGHTIFHRPDRGITFQAGKGAIIAAKTGIPVVSDFRREDVAGGGQGAPLVPVGDRFLFGEYGACLNLGGFANISFEGETGKRFAYDVGPANLGLNYLAGLAGLEFDRYGQIAARGNPDSALLKALNSLEYFEDPIPKSLGKEWFNAYFLPLINRNDISIPDRLATLSKHIGIQTGRAIRDSGAAKVLLTGGGALNDHLVERIRKHSEADIVIPDVSLVMYKEALIFAFLAYLRWRGEINCLCSVTGGQRDLSTGVIHKP